MIALLTAALMLLPACESAPRNFAAINAYYDYEFTDAREALRGDSYLRNDEQTLLNNIRLGMASLADGDLDEAERAFEYSFDLLSTAGLNRDRTTAAVLSHEGVRIWKGEPFEQALSYYYVGALYAVMGDWENARAATANAIFRLTDFGGDKSPEDLAREAARDDDYLETGYTPVESDFTLGYLMQAIAADLSNSGGAKELFDAALTLDPDLQPLIEQLKSRDYDTLLLVDYGKGPTKLAYGPDRVLVHFVQQDSHDGPLLITANGGSPVSVPAVCSVNRMAEDLRWNNLEDIRRAKSFIGDAMILSGALVAGSGRGRDNLGERLLIGAGLIGGGFLSKSGAKADTRYLEFLPQKIYIAPLLLEETTRLRITLPGDAGATVVLRNVEPGVPGKPRAVYLRLHGPDSPAPSWLIADDVLYTNDHTGVRPGEYPWILGGRDVSTPSRQTLEQYHRGGHLLDFTLNDLLALYEAEEILIGSGMETQPDTPRSPSFRHILEGGSGLFTPAPDSLGYKQLMYAPHPPYEPKSDLVRNEALAIGVQQEDRAQENYR